jgi:hypothetical protein
MWVHSLDLPVSQLLLLIGQQAGRPRDGVTARQPRSKPRPQERPAQGYCTIHVASCEATTHPQLEAWMHDHTHPCPGATCRYITPNHRSQPLPLSRARRLWSPPEHCCLTGEPQPKPMVVLGSGFRVSAPLSPATMTMDS